MNAEEEVYISAHSAASALARRLVEEKKWTPEKALEFTELIYNLVHTNKLPDDAKMLGLILSDWEIETPQEKIQADSIEMSL